jgi:hypothetical protein
LFPKNRELASIVSYARVLTRVRDLRLEPGSLNATDLLDFLFVLLTFGLKVRRIAVQNVDIAWVHVDMGKEMLVHEAVVTLRMVPRDAHVFVLAWSAYFGTT